MRLPVQIATRSNDLRIDHQMAPTDRLSTGAPCNSGLFDDSDTFRHLQSDFMCTYMQFYVYLTALQLEHHIINIVYWVKKRSYSSWWNEPSSNINWQKCITFRFRVWHNLTLNCEGKGELVEWTMERHWQKCIYSEFQCLTPFYFELQRSGYLPHRMPYIHSPLNIGICLNLSWSAVWKFLSQHETPHG
jgi:hypothetical protein